MLIHRPEGWKASDKRPAIVFFFGGGGPMARPGSSSRRQRTSRVGDGNGPLPPTLLLYGSKDRLGEPAEPFLARAKAKGARAELDMAEGVGHGFFNRPPSSARTLRCADEFLGSLGYIQGPPTLEAP